MLSKAWIIGFMRQLGCDLTAVLLQADLEKEKHDSRNMPIYRKKSQYLFLITLFLIKFGKIV